MNPVEPRARSKWKTVRIVLLALFLAALVPLVPLVGLLLYWNHNELGGLPPGWVGAVDHNPRLTLVVAEARSMIDALEKYRAQHGLYPKELKDAGVVTDSSGNMVYVEGGYYWAYQPITGRKTYALFRKLGWDPSLHYQFDQGVWRWWWEPGDGSEGKYLEL